MSPTSARRPWTGLVLGLLLLSAACRGESPEDRLRRTIQEAREAAVAGDHDRLGSLVSETYSDEQGRDRAELLRLVRAYLSYMAPVHVLVREKSLRVTEPGRAEATMLVAVASGPLESVSDISRISADIARVELVFEDRRGEWKLVRVRHEAASVADWL